MADRQTFSNIIRGEERAAVSEETLDIIDPATGEVYATSPRSGPDDVDAAFRAAQEAFESWRWRRYSTGTGGTDGEELEGGERPAVTIDDTGPKWTRSGAIVNA